MGLNLKRIDDHLETDTGRIDEIEFSIKRIDAMEKYYKNIDDRVVGIDGVMKAHHEEERQKRQA